MFVLGVKPNCCLILWGIISVGGKLFEDGYVVLDIVLVCKLYLLVFARVLARSVTYSLACVFVVSEVYHPKKPSILAATVGWVSSVYFALVGTISVISPEEQHHP